MQGKDQRLCRQLPSMWSHPPRSLPVEISDVDMKFSTMFWFLIKLSFAAAPAVIVVYTAWTIIGGVMNPLLHM
jgi:hypothetical protein